MDASSPNLYLSDHPFPSHSFLWLGLAEMDWTVHHRRIREFLRILWRSSTRILLGMVDFPLSESRTLHSENKCLIFFQKLCYECILEPYNELCPHSVQKVSFLSVHFQILSDLVDPNPLQFRNQSVWPDSQHQAIYSKASNLCALFDTHYGAMK